MDHGENVLRIPQSVQNKQIESVLRRIQQGDSITLSVSVIDSGRVGTESTDLQYRVVDIVRTASPHLVLAENGKSIQVDIMPPELHKQDWKGYIALVSGEEIGSERGLGYEIPRRTEARRYALRSLMVRTREEQ